MLLFAKLSTCYYMWFCFGYPRLKISWLKCKICLKFENLRIIDWKSYFWKIWIQNKCFWIAFHLILMHFIYKILCFEEFLHKIAMFFKNYVFQIFDRSNMFFDQSKMWLKFWFESDQFDCCSIGSRSIEGTFDRSNLTFDQSKIV